MLYGIHIGEHAFGEKTVIDEINVRVTTQGYKLVIIRTHGVHGQYHFAEQSKP